MYPSLPPRPPLRLHLAFLPLHPLPRTRICLPLSLAPPFSGPKNPTASHQLHLPQPPLLPRPFPFSPSSQSSFCPLPPPFFLPLAPSLCLFSGPLVSCLCSGNLNEKITHYFHRLPCAIPTSSNRKPCLSTLIWPFVRVGLDAKDSPPRD